MDHIFSMNGVMYETDKETFDLLKTVVVSAKASDDYSAVAAIMTLGQAIKRIVEVEDNDNE